MSKRTFVAFVLSAMLLPAVSQAVTVINGDFESGLFGWTERTIGSPSSVVIANGVSGNVSSLAHLSASADFTWNDSGWQGDTASADLASHFFSLGQGETTLTFQALAVGVGEGILPPYVSFISDGNASGAFGYDRIPITGTGWNTYTLELRDLSGNFLFLPAGSMVAVFADVLANTPSYTGTTTGDEVHMQSDLYVDNFTTTVVPEPVTMVSLLVALAGNVVYIRRRMAA